MTPDPAPSENDLVEILRRLRFDLTVMQAKVSDALTLAARLAPPPELKRCPACGLGFRSGARLREHAYHQHGGPEPSHWLEAAALAASETDPDEEARIAFSEDRSAYDPDNDDPGRLEHRGKAAGVNGLTAPGSGDEA